MFHIFITDKMWLVYMTITTIFVIVFILCGKFFAKKNQRHNQYPTYGSTQLGKILIFI
jgi:hypothetical protein